LSAQKQLLSAITKKKRENEIEGEVKWENENLIEKLKRTTVVANCLEHVRSVGIRCHRERERERVSTESGVRAMKLE